MALDEVAAETGIGGHRPFQVHPGALPQCAEVGAVEGLGHHIDAEGLLVELGDGQADAVDADRVPVAGVGDHHGTTDAQYRGVLPESDIDDVADLLDNAGEHGHASLLAGARVSRTSGPTRATSTRSRCRASARVPMPRSATSGRPAPSRVGAR
ncbi:hypothetical protein SDC9_145575 [bioreactor metagenome]|uniref:Uncharacterized protein n=1 Tax=bioreactor metagenome TaxID=1076179 RepID=A0A645EAH9_9ZZZZ